MITACPFDTDGDGNCPAHPRGCAEALEPLRREERHRLETLIVAAWPDGANRWHTDALFHATVCTAVQMLLAARDGDESWLDTDRVAAEVRQIRVALGAAPRVNAFDPGPRRP